MTCVRCSTRRSSLCIAGEDALLLAPTAGGKTEAAMFPLLSRMAAGAGRAPRCSICVRSRRCSTTCPAYGPLRGLARTDRGTVARGRGRSRAPGHPAGPAGHPAHHTGVARVDAGRRQRRPRAYFADIRAVVVDEVHAFAGDDRGWHLLAVLERLTDLIGRPVQRVGLSATVGNPTELLTWLQGSGRAPGGARGRAPRTSGIARCDHDGPPPGDIELDYVGSVDNAATVIASLHAGEKRLVFCESRKLVEELGELLARQRA